MKKRALSALLAMALVLTLMPAVVFAADWEGHWAAPYIERAVERGWMQGGPDGSMRPDDSITRAEFVVMLWRAAGNPAPDDTHQKAIRQGR